MDVKEKLYSIVDMFRPPQSTRARKWLVAVSIELHNQIPLQARNIWLCKSL
jgi:hypothetical protein